MKGETSLAKAKQIISEMSFDDLKSAYESVYCSITVTECFSTKDLLLFILYESELERRGYVRQSRGMELRKING